MAAIIRGLAALSILLLIGCTNPMLPPLELSPPDPNKPIGPTVRQVVKHIECELENAATSGGDYNDLVTEKYVAHATLTMDVTDVEGLTPSLSFVTPFGRTYPLSGPTPNNLAWNIGAQLSGAQHRNFNTNISFSFAQEAVAPLKAGTPRPSIFAEDACADRTDHGWAIKGELGLRDTILNGLTAVHSNDHSVQSQYAPDSVTLSGATATSGLFGSQIDFTVVEGLGFGPNWTLTYFKGIGAGTALGGAGGAGGGAGNTGPIAVNRTAKDTLQIYFAPTCNVRFSDPDKRRLEARLKRRPEELLKCRELAQIQKCVPSPPVSCRDIQEGASQVAYPRPCLCRDGENLIPTKTKLESHLSAELQYLIADLRSAAKLNICECLVEDKVNEPIFSGEKPHTDSEYCIGSGGDRTADNIRDIGGVKYCDAQTYLTHRAEIEQQDFGKDAELEGAVGDLKRTVTSVKLNAQAQSLEALQRFSSTILLQNLTPP